jgi:hypothetical protein
MPVNKFTSGLTESQIAQSQGRLFKGLVALENVTLRFVKNQSNKPMRQEIRLSLFSRG